ncbi:hypothetical protein G0Q06_01275 [Puniceicoccales bacterium CK1056]|uniref:Uncharacterized protein n=1 Tax=Oceanipulchritudo coccoides TaxID=2706888 RepID=A0A6B2LXQ7_9BACT|nr:hypothetical protein [Oceanipulchritudo coccoides]NDV61073.1 hypothetical protein [Oceanipulchritudo coccoides]
MKTALLLCRCFTVLLIVGLSGPLSGHSGIDSGGGKSAIGTSQNHVSIGSPFETAPGTAGGYRILVGLIEVMYPSLPLDPNADLDGNGLPDWWELENFGHIGVDPDDDPDKDRATNKMEMLAKTDPNDPASVFRPAVYLDGTDLILPVQTQTERNYIIWGSHDLSDWTLLDTLVGDETLVEWSYPIGDPADLPYFLLVEIVLP